jgi:hypothetical protein
MSAFTATQPLEDSLRRRLLRAKNGRCWPGAREATHASFLPVAHQDLGY